MPKISVIIPVYNAAAFLRQCLDSVRDQRLTDLEVLCIDAGCTDDSPAILREYAENDPRFRIFSGYGRLDAGSARNIGLSEAAGEYLSFLDADDFFHRDMLWDAWKKGSAEQADIVIFMAQQLDMRSGIVSHMPWSLRGKNCPRTPPFAPADMAGKLFNSFENWTWNKLFRREFILNCGITFQSIPRTNDMAFTCQALARAERISCLNKSYVTYRIGTGTSLQQTNDHSPTCFWEAYRETRRRLIADGLYETYRQSFLNAVLNGTMYNLRSVKQEEARQQILTLLRREAEDMGLTAGNGAYFYNQYDYQEFTALITGGELPKPPSALRTLIRCWSDHGAVYTIRYTLQKLLHRG